MENNNNRRFLIIAAIVIFVYSIGFVRFGIDYGLFMDDMWFLQSNHTLESIFSPLPNQEIVRPVPEFLFLVANKLGDLNLWGHIFNGFVHALTLLISLIVLLDLASGNCSGSLRRRDYVIIAALSSSQLLHLSSGSNVLWVAGLQTLLGGLFFVLAVWAVIRYQRTKKRLWLVLLMLSAFVGLFSYEAVLALIVVAPAVFWYLETSHPLRYAKYVLGSVLFPFLIYLLFRLLSGSQPSPETSIRKGILVHSAEYLVVMLNGIDRSLFSYMIDLNGHLTTSNWLNIIMFTAIPVIGFYSLLGFGVLRGIQERRYRFVVMAFALVVLGSLPILVFRRAFVPRLGYLQVFSFMLVLAFGFWDKERRSSLFLWASVILLIAQVYSFVGMLDSITTVKEIRTRFVSSITKQEPSTGLRLIGLSPYSYRDFPVLASAEEELAWRAGVRTSSSALGLYILENVGSPTPLAEQVACTKESADSFRYTVLYPSLYIKGQGVESQDKYYVGESVDSENGFHYVVLNVNKGGYITELELSIPKDGMLVDCEYWEGREF